MHNAIQAIVELEQQASALARSATVESAGLRAAQEHVTGVAAGMSVLADKAVEVAASFRDKLVVVESDLRPPAQMMVLMTGILKHIKELSESVENTLQSQKAATQSLAVSVGEAVGAGTRITSQIVALAEALQTFVPMVGNKRKLEAELTSLTAELHNFVAHFRNYQGNMASVVRDTTTSRLLGKPPSIN
jgi:ABC-type transporter Mla subunit MlaD